MRDATPDVLLLDITMPGLGGLAVLSRIMADYPLTRVIMLSMHDNEEYVGQALKMGAAGYLLKDSDLDELGFAIRSVLRGGSYLTPAVSRHVIRDFTRGGTSVSPFEGLSPRQTEVVQLVGRGPPELGDRSDPRHVDQDRRDPPGAGHGPSRCPRRDRSRALRDPRRTRPRRQVALAFPVRCRGPRRPPAAGPPAALRVPAAARQHTGGWCLPSPTQVPSP